MTTSKYEFTKFLRSGGTGQVWEAKDIVLGRIVAIKLFEPGGSNISSAVDHAQALARVEHPNIVGIYELRPFSHPDKGEEWNAIVMEKLNGKCLADLTEDDLSNLSVKDIGLGILSGLEALHAKGIVHGDLNGYNIMLHNEQPKLLDVLYRGTMAACSSTLQASLRSMDLRNAIAELAHLIVLSGRDEAAIAFRRLAHGAADIEAVRTALVTILASPELPAPPPPLALMTEKSVWAWHLKGKQSRGQAQQRTGLADPNTNPYQHGCYSVSYSIQPSPSSLRCTHLRKLMAEVKQWTGWPAWLILPGENKPYMKAGLIECHITKRRNEVLQPDNSDFWVASEDAGFFLTRGYGEDSPQENPKFPPGTKLSASLAIWRLGECVLHSLEMSRLLDCLNSEVYMAVEFTGLKERELTYWPSRLHFVRNAGGRCHEDSYRTLFAFRPGDIELSPKGIHSLIHEPLDRLFEQFDFAEVSPEIYMAELSQLMP